MSDKSTRFLELIFEPENPNPILSENWEKIDQGLHASIISIDTRFDKNVVPNIDKRMEWKGIAWRGENVSAQIVLWSREIINGIHFEFTNFIGNNGEELPKDIARARFVRYVLTDEFGEGNGCAERKPEDFSVSLSADILDNVTILDIDNNSVRPVWLTFKIPQNAKAGK